MPKWRALIAADLSKSSLAMLQPNGWSGTTYTPYGDAPKSSLGQVKFKGERLERATGHYLLGNGYRAFTPFLQRFNSPDSLSPFEDGGLNTYVFALNDPINRVDPTGHVSGKPLLHLDGVIAIANRTWRGKRLTLQAHGLEGVVKVKEQILSAEQFYNYLNLRGIALDSYSKIHLVICHSASSSTLPHASFAQQLADYSQTSITAYDGQPTYVTTYSPNSEEMSLKVLKTDTRDRYRKTHDMKNEGRFSYEPRNFKPSTAAHQVRQS
ncbi:RHS repeat-associated core domain-containing protein [Pseudomonas sp. BJa3]|uniref:RHS repeat-associated core domain-containing protein n=1 Tax=Pseudomonas sp. BJa3 TaxID=2986525 RepID=UPI002265CAEE|nr:RHS repeat-associated core domain-containing protein [Pseudomonas sp. BJa3]MCX5511131.1 RHS repeat-associated core domain-containing protein [Pseudomonas sp. BJa3]